MFISPISQPIELIVATTIQYQFIQLFLSIIWLILVYKISEIVKIPKQMSSKADVFKLFSCLTHKTPQIIFSCIKPKKESKSARSEKLAGYAWQISRDKWLLINQLIASKLIISLTHCIRLYLKKGLISVFTLPKDHIFHKMNDLSASINWNITSSAEP